MVQLYHSKQMCHSLWCLRITNITKCSKVTFTLNERNQWLPAALNYCTKMLIMHCDWFETSVSHTHTQFIVKTCKTTGMVL